MADTCINITLEILPLTNEVRAKWVWEYPNTQKYEARWYYYDSFGNRSDITANTIDVPDDPIDPSLYWQNSFSIPDTAIRVCFYVKPYSKTYDVNGTETSYWISEFSTVKDIDVRAVNLPSDLQVDASMDETFTTLKMGVTINPSYLSGSPPVTDIEFQIYIDDTKVYAQQKFKPLQTGYVTWNKQVIRGHSFKVRSRAWSNSVAGKWGDYTAPLLSAPDSTEITALYPKYGSNATYNTLYAHVEWKRDADASSYDVQYATRGTPIGSDQATTITVTSGGTGSVPDFVDISNLESGYEYWFRVKVYRDNGQSQASSQWSNVKYISMGLKPSIPTTWSNTEKISYDPSGSQNYEKAELKWMHNSEDNSLITRAIIKFMFKVWNGGIWGIYEPDNYGERELIISYENGERTINWQAGSGDVSEITDISIDNNGVCTCSVDYRLCHSMLGSTFLNNYDFEILWSVKTAGVYKESGSNIPAFGDYSETRSVSCYCLPQMKINLFQPDGSGNWENISDSGTLTRLPLQVNAQLYTQGGYSVNQSILSYNIKIISLDEYDTVDEFGNTESIRNGDVIYETDTTISEEYGVSSITKELSANDITLANNIHYRAIVITTLNSTYLCQDAEEFQVLWNSGYDTNYQVGSELGINKDDMTAYLRPYAAKFGPAYDVSSNINSGEDYTKPDVVFDPTGDGRAYFCIDPLIDTTTEDKILYFTAVVNNCVVSLAYTENDVTYVKKQITATDSVEIYWNTSIDNINLSEHDYKIYIEPIKLAGNGGVDRTVILVEKAVLWDPASSESNILNLDMIDKDDTIITAISLSSTSASDRRKKIHVTYSGNAYTRTDTRFNNADALPTAYIYFNLKNRHSYYFTATVSNCVVTLSYAKNGVRYAKKQVVVNDEQVIKWDTVDTMIDGSYTYRIYFEMLKSPHEKYGTNMTIKNVIICDASDVLRTNIFGDTDKVEVRYDGSYMLHSMIIPHNIRTLIDNVKLSVYRKTFDGSFVEIESNIDNTDNEYVIDPHPSIDFARYRIVSKNQLTGSVLYSDVITEGVGVPGVIIQWDEEWEPFDPDNIEEHGWSGSLLNLKYNVDISNSYDVSKTLVNYAGRKHPVAYYGTQVDEKQSWSLDVPKYDKETLYALRRLSVWNGNVYIREHSGSGYWATVTVSFSINHTDVVIPVTIEVTRIEGGA